MKKARVKSKDQKWILPLSLMVTILVPMIVAWSLFSTKSYTSETLSNGHLIQPPLSFQNLSLSNELGQEIDLNYFGGGWLMVYVVPGACTKTCQQNLYNMQQIRLALGKDMNRVKRVILTLSNQRDPNLTQLLSEAYLGTIHVSAERETLTKFLDPLPSKKLCLEEGYLYIVDPHGNMMMSYQSDQNPHGILVDMKRLLDASQIG